ncbi:hypothetical protein Bca101_082766 [Brassica carinata]
MEMVGWSWVWCKNREGLRSMCESKMGECAKIGRGLYGPGSLKWAGLGCRDKGATTMNLDSIMGRFTRSVLSSPSIRVEEAEEGSRCVCNGKVKELSESVGSEGVHCKQLKKEPSGSRQWRV